MKVLIFAMAAVLTMAVSVNAQMHQWTDKNGVKRFSNTPPPEEVGAVEQGC